MKITARPLPSDAVGLDFDADFSTYRPGRNARIVCRAAELVLDLGEKLILRLSRPMPGDTASERDGIARVLADRAQFLPLETLCATRPTAPTQSGWDDDGRATLSTLEKTAV
jgi:hypothetical protein